VDRGREAHFRRKLDEIRRIRRGESPVVEDEESIDGNGG